MNNGQLAPPSWYAIHTKPKEEDRADDNLRAWGVETFTPRVRERRLRQFTNQPRYIIKPLFPRYIFARFNAGRLLHKIYFTRGVSSVVSYGGQPVAIEDETIQLIQGRVRTDGFICLAEELKPGDEVTINDGPFRGLSGIFDRRLKDSARVSILLDSVTYQARITVDSHLVQRVAAT